MGIAQILGWRQATATTTAPRSRVEGACPLCGGTDFQEHPVLWPELIAEWELSAEEVASIDRQQGRRCAQCHSQWRIMALAHALLEHAGWPGTFQELCAAEEGPLRKWRILELNEAGRLFKKVQKLPHHLLAKFPEVDMTALPYADATWDLIVHSDTLEHVPAPEQALRECHRVLAPGGVLAFTVPVIPGRLSRTREGLPPSYHGQAQDRRDDYQVQTEYGADVWCQVLRAGFGEVRLHTLDYPASLAIVARKR